MSRFDFAARNTPLQPADRLGAALGLGAGSLWIKRDDLTGLPAGGNKARKLERLVADAVAQRCDVLVTGGAAQSNHVRATGAAARAAGLRCVAVLAEREAPRTVEGNLVLDDLFGIEVVWCRPAERRDVQRRTVEALRVDGCSPYSIPLGGSSPVGAAAYADAADEIVGALDGHIPLVVTAVGTGGTHAGLAVGLGAHDRVLGVDVAAVAGVASAIGPLADAAARHLGRPAPTGEVRLDTSQATPAYGEPYDELFDTIRLVADTEGLVLDPVYSGRAMTGLRAALANGRVDTGERIVFVHTGGLPALFTDRYAHRFAVREAAIDLAAESAETEGIS